MLAPASHGLSSGFACRVAGSRIGFGCAGPAGPAGGTPARRTAPRPANSSSGPRTAWGRGSRLISGCRGRGGGGVGAALGPGPRVEFRVRGSGSDARGLQGPREVRRPASRHAGPRTAWGRGSRLISGCRRRGGGGVGAALGPGPRVEFVGARVGFGCAGPAGAAGGTPARRTARGPANSSSARGQALLPAYRAPGPRTAPRPAHRTPARPAPETANTPSHPRHDQRQPRIRPVLARPGRVNMPLVAQ